MENLKKKIEEEKDRCWDEIFKLDEREQENLDNVDRLLRESLNSEIGAYLKVLFWIEEIKKAVK